MKPLTDATYCNIDAVGFGVLTEHTREASGTKETSTTRQRVEGSLRNRLAGRKRCVADNGGRPSGLAGLTPRGEITILVGRGCIYRLEVVEVTLDLRRAAEAIRNRALCTVNSSQLSRVLLS